MTGVWIKSFEHGNEWAENLNGVDWYEAKSPRWWQRPWHKHAPQTRGRVGGGYIERCVCGAARPDSDGSWITRRGW
jgi:hypothetical protein